MDPLSKDFLASTAPLAAEALGKVLGRSDRRPLARQAKSILTAAASTEDQVRSLIKDARRRIERTWRIALFMCIALFVLFVGMVVSAIITGLVTGKSTFPVIFGTVSVASFLTVVIWKPYEKMLQATMTAQRLDLVLLGLEASWTSCKNLPDAAKQSKCVADANNSALEELAKISESQQTKDTDKEKA